MALEQDYLPTGEETNTPQPQTVDTVTDNLGAEATAQTTQVTLAEVQVLLSDPGNRAKYEDYYTTPSVQYNSAHGRTHAKTNLGADSPLVGFRARGEGYTPLYSHELTDAVLAEGFSPYGIGAVIPQVSRGVADTVEQ